MIPMRLIYISQGNIPSKWAHTFQAMKMAEAFARLVDDFTLVTQAHWSAWLRRRFDYEGWYGIRRPFRIARLPARGIERGPVFENFRFPGFDHKAVRWATARQPDLVYTRSPLAGELSVRRGLPTVVESHMDLAHPEFAHLAAVKDSPALAGVVTISDELKAQYAGAGIGAGRILVWPDAVDLDAFARPAAREAVLAGAGIRADAFVAVYCGHLYRHRGVEEILGAAALLPDVQFLLVGGWEKDVEERRRESAPLRNVHFTGFVANSRVPDYLCAADVLLMPYSAACNTAAWMSPLKLFEYMAAGRAIVATDLPAIRRHLREGEQALLVPPDEAPAIAAAIGQLRDDAALRARLGAAAREAVAPFTWSARARAILEWVGVGRVMSDA